MVDHSKKRGIIKWTLLDIYLLELMWGTTDDPATPLDIFLFLDQVCVSVRMTWAQNMEL